MSGEQNSHSGHRQRMRERLMNDPLLTGFADHEVLEVLLYYCIPRANTNGIAHSLIYHFGSLDAVLTASTDELAKSGLVSSGTAISLSFFGSVCGYMRRGPAAKHISVNSLKDIKDHISALFKGEKREVFLMIGVHPRKEMVCNRIIAIGDDRQLFYEPESLYRAVINFGFKDIILAHNHPFSASTPSSEDIDTTKRLLIQLKDLDITVLDHLIAGEADIFSFREHGLMFDLF